MNDTSAASAPAMLRRFGSLLTPEMIAIVTVGITLGALILATTDRIATRVDKAIAESAAERRVYQAQAAAERRAFQAEMDEFRKRMDEYRSEIRGPGERQGHLEGRREGAADR